MHWVPVPGGKCGMAKEVCVLRCHPCYNLKVKLEQVVYSKGFEGVLV